MIAEISLLIALLLAGYLLVSNISAARRVKRLKKNIRTEQTRTAWAEAREQLFSLVRDEKLDPRSATFRQFYQLQTFVMRRPDAYDEIAEATTAVLISGQPLRRPGWWDERANWPAEMKDVLEQMSKGLISLIMFHSGLVRAVRGIFALVGHARKEQERRGLDEVEESLIKRLQRDESTEKMMQARREMEELQLSVA